jgi:hypothetical protein
MSGLTGVLTIARPRKYTQLTLLVAGGVVSKRTSSPQKATRRSAFYLSQKAILFGTCVNPYPSHRIESYFPLRLWCVLVYALDPGWLRLKHLPRVLPKRTPTRTTHSICVPLTLRMPKRSATSRPSIVSTQWAGHRLSWRRFSVLSSGISTEA